MEFRKEKGECQGTVGVRGVRGIFIFLFVVVTRHPSTRRAEAAARVGGWGGAKEGRGGLGEGGRQRGRSAQPRRGLPRRLRAGCVRRGAAGAPRQRGREGVGRRQGTVTNAIFLVLRGRWGPWLRPCSSVLTLGMRSEARRRMGAGRRLWKWYLATLYRLGTPAYSATFAFFGAGASASAASSPASPSLSAPSAPCWAPMRTSMSP